MHILAQLSFTTRERELDYITKRWIFELPHELSNDFRLRISGSKETSRKWLHCLELMRKYSAGYPKCKFRHLCHKISKYQVSKHFIDKPMYTQFRGFVCIIWSKVIRLQKTHGHQTWQSADLQWEAPILQEI